MGSAASNRFFSASTAYRGFSDNALSHDYDYSQAGELYRRREGRQRGRRVHDAVRHRGAQTANHVRQRPRGPH